MALPVRDSEWFLRAACLGLDSGLFFEGFEFNEETVRGLCLGCPVRRDCLHSAINEFVEGPYSDTEDFGFRGGETPEGRDSYFRAYVGAEEFD